MLTQFVYCLTDGLISIEEDLIWACVAVFLDNWEFKIATLGCHVIFSHTARAVADHVSLLMKEYFPDPKKLYLTTCHDGTANMAKTSQYLKSANYHHCAAHRPSLHLLLTTDSITKLSEVIKVLQKCKNIVSALHFKSHVVEGEIAASDDKLLIDQLQKKVAETSNLLDLDEQFQMSMPDETDENDAVDHHHKHQSLKSSSPRRWNSVFGMVDSVVQLQREVDNALKRIGRIDLCLHQHELDFLTELVEFLKPFKDLTDLFSCSSPALSAIPMMKVHIKKHCSTESSNVKIQSIKESILEKLDYRFPEIETVKFHQLLDPATKDLIPRSKASEILDRYFQTAVKGGFISVMPNTLCAAAATTTTKDTDVRAEEDLPDMKRRRLRMEMVNELRSQLPASCSDSLICTL